MNKITARAKSLTKKNRKYLRPLSFAGIFAILGIMTLLYTRAATPTASVEPENGTVASPASTIANTGASNGSFVKFGNNATPGTCPTGQLGTYPNCVTTPNIATAAGKSWRLNFQEEFNGTDYDHSKFTPCFDWNYGACTNTFNKGREHYQPSQVRVSGGTAKLVAEPLSPPLSSPDCLNNSCTYKSGLLATSRPLANNGSDYLYKFTYGYIEARAKIVGTQGFFSTIWMLPANPSFDYRSEIDIFEVLGDDPQTIFMTYHYNNRSQSHTVNNGTSNNGACSVQNYSQGFHNYGLDWQPAHIAWYIDGVKCGQFTNTSQIENGPMQLIIDLMVDHNWQQNWGVTLQDPTLVRQMELDYVRIFQQQ